MLNRGRRGKPISQFVLDLTNHQELVGRQVTLFVQGTVQTLFNEIQSGGRFSPGTPIATGFHRANWYGGIGGPGQAPNVTPPKTHAPMEKAAAVAAAQEQLRAIALAAKPGDLVVLSNNGPAIRRLEFGWSKQAPRGFIRLALMHGQEIADEVAQHVFQMRA